MNPLNETRVNGHVLEKQVDTASFQQDSFLNLIPARFARVLNFLGLYGCGKRVGEQAEVRCLIRVGRAMSCCGSYRPAYSYGVLWTKSTVANRALLFVMHVYFNFSRLVTCLF